MHLKNIMTGAEHDHCVTWQLLIRYSSFACPFHTGIVKYSTFMIWIDKRLPGITKIQQMNDRKKEQIWISQCLPLPTWTTRFVGIGNISQQYSTNENPSLSRSNFLANLMHGHGDSSWSRSSLPEITEQRLFHVLFYYEQIRLKCIINCIYPSLLNF